MKSTTAMKQPKSSGKVVKRSQARVNKQIEEDEEMKGNDSFESEEQDYEEEDQFAHIPSLTFRDAGRLNSLKDVQL